MTDPIIIDTNVLKHISRGQTGAAEALRKYVDGGTKVYIAQASYDELVKGAPSLQMGGEYREILKDLHIEVAPSGSLKDRLEFQADNMSRVPAPNTPGQINDWGGKEKTRPGDSFVASQTKAVGGKLWTMDETFAKRAKAMGVELAPECALKGATGPESTALARKSLGLGLKTVGPSGVVVPRPTAAQPGAYSPTKKPPPGSGAGNPGAGSAGSAGSGTSGSGAPAGSKPPAGGTGSGAKGGSGGGAGTTASVGVAENGPSFNTGPSPRGQAIVGGMQLALEGINFTLNFVNDQIQKAKVEQALNSARPMLSKQRTDNPRLGVLLLFYYTQAEALPDSIIKPGAVFQFLGWGKGVTRDEALADYRSAPSISAGVGPNERRYFQDAWIPPLVKTSVTTAKSPLPPVAIGQFLMETGNKVTFQRVEFDAFGGFDDLAEKTIQLPAGINPEFAILAPTAEVPWFNQNGRQTTGVALKNATTANGNTIKVVDLDPYSPFHAAAAMCFPVDDLTEEVFKIIEETQGAAVLAMTNFSMVRWIRAEHIHLLRFL